MIPRQEDFSTVLGRMTDCVLEMLRASDGEAEITIGGLREAGFTDDEIKAHVLDAIRQAREIYEGETRESGNG